MSLCRVFSCVVGVSGRGPAWVTGGGGHGAAEQRGWGRRAGGGRWAAFLVLGAPLEPAAAGRTSSPTPAGEQDDVRGDADQQWSRRLPGRKWEPRVQFPFAARCRFTFWTVDDLHPGREGPSSSHAERDPRNAGINPGGTARGWSERDSLQKQLSTTLPQGWMTFPCRFSSKGLFGGCCYFGCVFCHRYLAMVVLLFVSHVQIKFLRD